MASRLMCVPVDVRGRDGAYQRPVSDASTCGDVWPCAVLSATSIFNLHLVTPQNLVWLPVSQTCVEKSYQMYGCVGQR